MLTFADFLEELTKKELTLNPLNPAEVRRMMERCGPKVLQMGNLQEDGSLLVPVDCILEAVQSLENRALSDAIKGLRSEDCAPMLESVDSLVERVAAGRAYPSQCGNTWKTGHEQEKSPKQTC